VADREEIAGADAPATADEFAGLRVVRGYDVEVQADAMEEAATQMAGLLASFASERNRLMDARAVFLAMARTAEQMRLAAGYLRQQDWLSFADEKEPETAVEWSLTLANLGNASRLFEEIANGWI